MAEDDRTRKVLQTLKYLFPPGRIIEIRAITEEGISSGYFSDYHKAAIDLLTRETDIHVSGIYVTLNEVNQLSWLDGLTALNTGSGKKMLPLLIQILSGDTGSQ